ncbi:MAG: hypothetical protein GXO40_04615, partial [Epsilonproteobacteria bacterium]|nr:hypothetical protein [Campylobacterota bacterium]
SLIVFYFVYKYYVYEIISLKIDRGYMRYISIILVYVLYFSLLESYYTINDMSFDVDVYVIVYYIMIEELLLFFDTRFDIKNL